jgi:hypothetical protein
MNQWTGPIPPANRFWPKVLCDLKTGCWVWTASCLPSGYGQFSISRNRARVAHRVSWEMHFGPIPDGLLVCHHCDNPPCVRPDHLFLGTDSTNAWDKVAKGRAPRGDAHPNRLHPEHMAHGDNHYSRRTPEKMRRKLSLERTAELKQRFTAGNVTRKALAAEFGVTYNRVLQLTSTPAVP